MHPANEISSDTLAAISGGGGGDGNNPLFRAVAMILQNMGGIIHLDPEGDNLLRRRRVAELGEHQFVIEVQGWPNLMHEFVHILALGYLEEDSGFNYRWIPLDVTQSLHRNCLWEELSCCVISCNYFNLCIVNPLSSALVSYDSAETIGSMDANVDEWFAEQVDILPVFYGLESRPADMVPLIEDCLFRYGWEFSEILNRLQRQVYEAIESTSQSTGLFSELKSKVNRFSFARLWEQYRAK